MPPGSPEVFVPAPAHVELDGVHVWRIRRGNPGLLNDAERERAERFRSAEARAAFVAGRAGVREIGARYAGIPAAALDWRAGADGKPFFANAGVAFNMSHSGGEVVAAFSRNPVGVDIERGGRTRDFREIARRFFHEDEVDGVGGEEDFLRLWTAKEAMLKLSGEGISGGLKSARPGPGGVGELAGRAVWWREFRVGGCTGAVASFLPFEVKGWFEI